jgi:hypothetical protein
MPEAWHDINDPGFFVKPESGKTGEKKSSVTDDASTTKEKACAVASLTDAKFVPPDNGVTFNEKCPARVAVSYKEKTSRTRVTFKLFCTYNDAKHDLKHKVDGNENNGVAECQLRLFYPDDYTDGPVEYFFTAEHARGDKAVESAKLSLPLEEKCSVVIRLDIAPDTADIQEDRFTLYSTDKDKSYSRKKTVKTDKKPGDNCLDLEFTDVPSDLSFSLEIETGKDEGKIIAFEDLSLSKATA